MVIVEELHRGLRVCYYDDLSDEIHISSFRRIAIWLSNVGGSG